MYRDETIRAVLLEIKNEIKKETNEDFSIEELFNIVNSQFVAGGLAANKRISVFYSYIGTFKIKNLKAYVQSIKDVKSIKEKVTDEVYEKIVQEKRIANKKAFSSSKIKLVTDLKDLPEDVSDRTVMRSYNKIYKELLNNEPIKDE